MGSHHHHHHHHSHSAQCRKNNATKNIAIAFGLNLGFSLIELVGGLLTGSLAILADALHDFGDSIALGLALVLEKVAKRSPDTKFSYGYRRLSLASAAITSLLLVTGTVYILAVSIPRLSAPVQPKTEGMFLLALLGIGINGYAALRVRSGQTLNEQTVSWHLLEDVLGWVAVLIGSVTMYFWDIPIVDPLLAIGFSSFILYGVSRNLWQVGRLFLQAVPTSIHVSHLREQVGALRNVLDVHDIHVWSLDGDQHVMTMHVVVSETLQLSEITNIKTEIRSIINALGRIHLTLEIESQNELCINGDCHSHIKTKSVSEGS